MKHRLRCGLALVAVFSVMAAACGSDNGGSAGTTAASGTTAAAQTTTAGSDTTAAGGETTAGGSDTTLPNTPATGTPIVVGTIGTDQSDAVSLAQMGDGLEAFATYLNAH